MNSKRRPSRFNVWFRTADGSEQYVEVRADIRASDDELTMLARPHVQRTRDQRWRFSRADLVA
jgi:hypothetical protein